MVCQDLSLMGSNIGLVELVVYPVTCYYYTYAIIFFALFMLLSLFLWNREKLDLSKPDMISSMGTSSTAILFLALIGSLISTDVGSVSIPMVSGDIFLYIFVIWIIIQAIWYFKRQ